MDFNDLTEEQRAQARECKTPEELLALAKELNIRLSDEELEAVSGGGSWCFDDCSDNVTPMNPM